MSLIELFGEGVEPDALKRALNGGLEAAEKGTLTEGSGADDLMAQLLYEKKDHPIFLTDPKVRAANKISETHAKIYEEWLTKNRSRVDNVLARI